MRAHRENFDGSETRVLIIEGNSLLREALLRTVKNEGFAPQSMLRWENDSPILKQTAPDLIILDENCLRVKAPEKIQRLRSDGIHVPIIFIANSTLAERKRSALSEAGVTEFISKPVSLAKIHRTIDRVMGAMGSSTLPQASRNPRGRRSNLFLLLMLLTTFSAALAATILVLLA